MWWPFKKKETIEYLDPKEVNFSQVDITDRFGDNLSFSKDKWIETFPVNEQISDGRLGNLPPVGASADEVYHIASELSEIRESFRLPDDGVYCPICHVANIDFENLRAPCPKCGRRLLAFGWS